MNVITLCETGADLHLQFPFPLREAFRSVFKTARWDSSARAYVVRETIANRNKFATFRDAAASTLQALDAADDAVATDEELEQIRRALATAK